MEGVLLKWTNYVNGWQQRYFTLTDGVLSYYRSKEEMDSGCKGSVKLSVCDVIVHSSDSRRFDLILGEQRYYLRALSMADRQRWVVALGSSKVGTKSDKFENSKSNESNTQAIINHRTELRLYQNLMVQQVKELQNKLKEGSVPDITAVDELTGMLNASCTTFLMALDELMSLTNSNSSSKYNSNLDNLISGSREMNLFVNSELNGSHLSNLCSTPQINTNRLNTNSIVSTTNVRRQHYASRKYQTFFSTMEYSFEDLKPNMPKQLDTSESDSLKLPGDYISALEFTKACRWLFSFLDRLASNQNNNNNNNNNGSTVNTLSNNQFPSVLRTYTILQQVRNDLFGNLLRIEMAIEGYSNKDKLNDEENSKSNLNSNHEIWFKQVQLSIGFLIRDEIKNKSIQNDNSVYMAILWLCRALNFVREFLHTLFIPTSVSAIISSSDHSITSVASEAYSRCLRSYHPWSVRGMAMVIIQSLPSRFHLLDLLLSDNPTNSGGDNLTDSPLVRYPESYIQLRLDANRFSESLGRFLTLIEGLFASLDLQRIFTGSETY